MNDDNEKGLSHLEMWQPLYLRKKQTVGDRIVSSSL